MYTTALAEIEGEGLVIVKIRRDDFKDQVKNNIRELSIVKRKTENLASLIDSKIHPNLLPIDIFETLDGGISMGFRQYMFTTLRERLGQVPKIQSIQKKWVTFQLIHSLKQLQNCEEFHGNITPENITLTSSDWVHLTD